MGQAPQLLGKGEDDVEVVGRKDALHLPVEPRGLSQTRALGTVAIPTGVVGWALEVAPVAHVDVAAKDGGAAGLDGAHGARLFQGQGVSRPVCLAMGAEDVRDLELGPPCPGRVTGRRRQDAVLAQHLPLRGAEHVEGALDRGQALPSDVQVAHRGLDPGVTEEDLDDAQIGAHLE